MKNHNLVAFYQSRDQAERARDELLSAGFDRNDTKIYAGNGNEGGGGFWESIKDAFGMTSDEDRALYAEAGRRGGVALAVEIDDDEDPSSQQAITILQRHNPIDLDTEASRWQAEGWNPHEGEVVAAQATETTTTRDRDMGNAGMASGDVGTGTGTGATGISAAATSGATNAGTDRPFRTEQNRGEREAIPVVEEQLNVGKRRVLAGGLRIHNRVTERPVEAQVQLREEHVRVERNPVDRPVTEGDTAFQERTIEATETSEVPVVSKEARVVEEVVLNKEAEERTETVRDTVRRTDVDVEKIPGDRGRSAQSSEGYEDFATELASDQRYRGREWDTLEPEARQSFEQRYPGSRWEQVKETVRRGYDRARNKIHD